MSTADQQRLLGTQRRGEGQGLFNASDECVFFGPKSGDLLDVKRFTDPSWPFPFANEVSYARLLASLGLATFKTFTTPGGGQGLVVHGSRPWETWAFGQKHGEVLSLTSYGQGLFPARLGPRLDETLRTLLARF